MEEKFELILQMTDKGIVCNAESLKSLLPSKLKKYEYVVDEANVKAAKEDRAKLNNLSKQIKDKRKEFEDTAFVDWKKAKPVLMEIEKIIEGVADKLGDGIKEVEEKEKLAKMETVRQDCLAVLPNLPIAVDFERLYDRKAYDKNTMTVKKIKEDIQDKINKIANDWEMMQLFIANLTPEEVELVKEVYIENYGNNPIGSAKAKADQLIKIKEKVAEQAQKVPSNENVVSPVEERVEHAQEMTVEKEKTIELMPRVFGGKFTLECLQEMMEVIKKHNCRILKVLKSDEEVNAWINQK